MVLWKSTSTSARRVRDPVRRRATLPPGSAWPGRSSSSVPARRPSLAERLDADPCRRPPPPGPPQRARAPSRPASRASTATRGRGRPAKVFALTEAGPRPLRPAVRRPGRPGAAVPRRDRRRRRGHGVRPPPGRPDSRAATEEIVELHPELTRLGGARPGADPERLRRLGPREPGRRAAVPAALPGGPRGPRVPPAVRGRDRGVQPGPRPPRPAAGHHRPRRRRLHHLSSPDHQPPPTSTARTTPERLTQQMTTDRADEPRARGPRPLRVRLGRQRRRRRHRPARPQRGRRARHLRRRRASRSGCSTCG